MLAPCGITRVHPCSFRLLRGSKRPENQRYSYLAHASAGFWRTWIGVSAVRMDAWFGFMRQASMTRPTAAHPAINGAQSLASQGNCSVRSRSGAPESSDSSRLRTRSAVRLCMRIIFLGHPHRIRARRRLASFHFVGTLAILELYGLDIFLRRIGVSSQN